MSCTFFPDGSWESCCDRHDAAYSKGTQFSRKIADQRLKLCVEQSGHPYIAKVMYAGVRAFGWLFYKGEK